MMNFKKFAACAASVVCLLGTSIMSVSAAEAVITDPYTYKVTVSTGNDLVFDATSEVFSNERYALKDNNRVLEITGLSYGDYVNIFDAVKTIDCSSTKYYEKGVRFTGSDEITVENFQVVGDADYVVAYGVLSDPVEYTVQYVDQNGNKLASDGKYYGNAGDKIIVASRQIDGYLPDANNKAMTLSKEKENVFTFVYHSSAGATNVIYNTLTGTTTYIYQDGTTSTVTIPNPANGQAGAVVTPPAANAGAGNANAGNAGAGNADAGNADAGNADAGNADENTVIADEDTPLTTQDIVDLDADEEVPLAAQAQETVTNLAPIIAGIFVAVAVAGMITLLVISRRRKAVNVKSEDSDK
ncbi:MAG: MucBP domain-containing protein [Lachnospiraceae bacterium]